MRLPSLALQGSALLLPVFEGVTDCPGTDLFDR